MPRQVVYISYDGMEDPLGQSQVLPYLRSLAGRGHRFELISFEKAPARTRVREPLAPGIHWTALRYHKEPTVPATAFDMLQGLAASGLLALLRRADLVHVRSYVAATMALPLARATNRPLLFDMRGFWPDERLSASGPWSANGSIYRKAKSMERILVTQSSAITVLTNSMADYLRKEAPFSAQIDAPIHVIPTCTDLSRFSPSVPRDPELAARLAGFRTLAYVGSVGQRYLSKEMARFYLAWRKVASPARLLVVSRQEPEEIRQVLLDAGVADEIVHVSAEHEAVPGLIRCAEAGLLFYAEFFASRGVAPTKLGEFLGSGLPVAGNPIGDVSDVLTMHDTGVVVRGFDDQSLAAAAIRLAQLSKRPDIESIARRTAEDWFSLDRGAIAYDALYASIGRDSATDQRWPRRA